MKLEDVIAKMEAEQDRAIGSKMSGYYRTGYVDGIQFGMNQLKEFMKQGDHE